MRLTGSLYVTLKVGTFALYIIVNTAMLHGTM